MNLRATSKRRRVTATLDKTHREHFLQVRRYVVGLCGRVSDAEVMRFAIRTALMDLQQRGETK